MRATLWRVKNNPDSQERKFIRDNAMFSTIVVSDSDETQNGSFFTTANGSIVQDFLNIISTKMPITKTYLNHSIIKLPGDTTCSSVEMEGVSYFELSNLTAGVSASICEPDYGAKMNIMGQKIINKVYEQKLDCVPVDVNNDNLIDVRINFLGNNSQITEFTVNQSTIQFATPLSDVGDYEITYNCSRDFTYATVARVKNY